MKILYGIQPDLCIANSELVMQHSQDVVLPKYFYLQLLHLKNGNFGSATDEATKIIDSLLPTSASEILDAKVVFITSSSEILSKCRFLHFDIGTIEKFSNISGESWLQPEMILNIQSMFDPITQIQWQEEETE